MVEVGPLCVLHMCVCMSDHYVLWMDKQSLCYSLCLFRPPLSSSFFFFFFHAVSISLRPPPVAPSHVSFAVSPVYGCVFLPFCQIPNFLGARHRLIHARPDLHVLQIKNSHSYYVVPVYLSFRKRPTSVLNAKWRLRRNGRSRSMSLITWSVSEAQLFHSVCVCLCVCVSFFPPLLWHHYCWNCVSSRTKVI